MKVVVKEYLNVRVGKPSVNAPCYQYLAPGSELEVDGQLYKGDTFENTDTWLKDAANNYYWSGGFNLDTSGFRATPNLPWNIRMLNLDKVWEMTRGKGVKVAILDTGVDLRNSDLRPAIVGMYNVLNGDDSVQDQGYHGTYCSTIVASRGSNGIFGVAPDCQLIIIKIADNEVVPDNVTQHIYNKNRLNGILKAIEFGADIISISFGSTNANQEIDEALRKASSQGIICICAAGNNPSNGVNYPANTKGIISVGNVACINYNNITGRGDFVLSRRSPKDNILTDENNEGITLVAPGDGVSAYDAFGNIVTPISGTSYSAPFVAGVAALWLSIMRTNGIPISNSHLAFRKFILTSSDRSSKNYDAKTWGAGVVNPMKLI